MNTHNLLLGILIVAVFVAGFLIGRFSNVGSTYIGSNQSASQGKQATSETDTKVGDTASTPSGTTINASSLTEGQKKLLGALGIDANAITVTQAMIVCAETSLGATRVEEIKGGATPSFSEGLKLAACYR